MNNEPVKWLVFLCVVAALVLAIWWGAESRPPSDFDGMLSGWHGGIWMLIAVCASGCAVWWFYARGPKVLWEFRAVGYVIATVLLVLALAAVFFAAEGLNMAGVHPAAERINGTITRPLSLARGQLDWQRKCAVELQNGITVHIHCEYLKKWNYFTGSEIPVLLYRGNLYYWGSVDVSERRH